jgi:hypothetical protein
LFINLKKLRSEFRVYLFPFAQGPQIDSLGYINKPKHTLLVKYKKEYDNDNQKIKAFQRLQNSIPFLFLFE